MEQAINEDPFLVRHLAANPSGDISFPENDTNYYERYLRIAAHLDKEVHPIVNQGSTLVDSGWLTDHGPAHIATVIRRASDLLNEDTFLTPYESYILLLSIHFHDVGNVFGRVNHEKKISEVMSSLPSGLMSDNGFERRLIRDIAQAHGGYADEDGVDRDTIGPLRKWDDDDHVRTQLLAAILRFADELADDYTRTSRFLIEGSVPTGSQVFHMYADRLRLVKINLNSNSIRINFELIPDNATEKYGKGEDSVYLFDEILERCTKMHREHTYCQKFFQKHIVIDTITVSIVVMTTDAMDIIETISFQMRQGGYPAHPETVQDICGELSFNDGQTLSSEIAKQLSIREENG